MSLKCFHRNKLSLFSLIAFSKKAFFASANEAFSFIAPEFEIFPRLLLMIKVPIFLCSGHLVV